MRSLKSLKIKKNIKKIKSIIQGSVILILINILVISTFSTAVSIDMDDRSFIINIELDNSYSNDFINTEPLNLISSGMYPIESLKGMPTGSRSDSRASTYSSTQIHAIHGGSLAGGIVSADFDGDDYHEIVVIGGTSEGRTTLIDYDLKNSTFTNQTLWWDPDGALVTIAIGDLDTSNSIPEILVGGYSGNLTLLHYNGSSQALNGTVWQTAPQNNDTTKLNHIWSIAIGDVDTRYIGNEIIVTDAATNFVYILSSKNSKWLETKVYFEDIPRSVHIGDFDEAHEGNEILVLSINGTVYKLAQKIAEPMEWSKVELFKERSAAMSAVIVDINKTNPGNEIVIAGLTWNTTLIWGNGNSWFNKTIWHASGALEGMAIGDFDELHDGLELCIAGYSNSAVMLYEAEGRWKNELIFHDPNIHQTELNGVLIQDIYPNHDGNELVVVGFQGPVWLLEFEQSGFDLDTPQARKEIEQTEFTTFRIDLKSFSGFNSSVELQITGLPEEVTYSFSRHFLTPSSGEDRSTESTVLTIDTYDNSQTGEFILQIVGEDIKSNSKIYLDLTLIINPKTKPADFVLAVSPLSIKLNLSKKEYYAELKINIIPLNQFDDFIDLFIETTTIDPIEAAKDIRFNINPSKIKPGETSYINLSISKQSNINGIIKIKLIGKNTDLGLVNDQDFKVEILQYQGSETSDGNGNGSESDDETSIQWVGLTLIGLVLLFIVIYIVIQTRRFSRADEQRRQEQRERKSNLNKGRIGKNRNTRISPKSRTIQRQHARDEYHLEKNQQFNKRR